MLSKGNYYGGQWRESHGESFKSISPVDLSTIWEGHFSSLEDLNECLISACNAQKEWENTPIEKRFEYVRKFASLVKENIDDIAKLISIEVGKPLWESKTEANALAGKIEPTISAYNYRNKELINKLASGATSITKFKPLGVIVTISPYNFPAHMANGHIIAALVCGNCVIWKPSERCPLVAERVMEIWHQVGLPDGVINLVQGNGMAGDYFCKDARINGVFFTGSYRVGEIIRKSCDTSKMCALEMGGDSPLVVWNVKNLKAAAISTIQSSYITAGQRCSAARRIIVKNDASGEEFLKVLVKYIECIKIGLPFDEVQPYMGPLKDEAFVKELLNYQEELLANGAVSLIKAKQSCLGKCFVTPGLIDITNIKNKKLNREVFGPLLRVFRANSLEEAIAEANNTEYGLAAGILTDKKEDYDVFYKNIKAGLVNWNQQLTGASGMAPFGGIKHSGNYRPSGYFAVDYCVYPVATIENEELKTPEKLPIGLNID